MKGLIDTILQQLEAKKYSSLCLLYLLVLTPMFSQNGTDFFIRGQVIDEVGRYPVAGAIISIKEEKVNAITNKEGYFSMKSKAKEDIVLTIEWMGKERTVIFVPSTGSKELDLKQVLIDAPMARAIFPKPINSSVQNE